MKEIKFTYDMKINSVTSNGIQHFYNGNNYEVKFKDNE